MVVKADARASVNGSAGARLAARCFRPVPRENCSESRIGSGQPLFRSVWPVRLLRAALHQCQEVDVRASRYQKAAFMVGISDQASILRLLTVMHRHTCTWS
jgi:hypothetical protein